MKIIERNLNGGVQKVYRFANNYGASVVRQNFSYGNEQGLWELAVINFPTADNNYELNYETEITDDVIGYLSDEEVEELLVRIEAL